MIPKSPECAISVLLLYNHNYFFHFEKIFVIDLFSLTLKSVNFDKITNRNSAIGI